MRKLFSNESELFYVLVIGSISIKYKNKNTLFIIFINILNSNLKKFMLSTRNFLLVHFLVFFFFGVFIVVNLKILLWIPIHTSQPMAG